MNERIQKLSNQAWEWAQTEANKTGNFDMADRAEGKFAELIVREFAYDCMDATGKPEMVKFAARYWGVEL